MFREERNRTHNTKIQCEFSIASSVSTLRSHIARSGGTHWVRYRDGCQALNIDINERAVPDEIKNSDKDSSEPNESNDIQATLDGHFTKQLQAPEWTKDGLLEYIVKFVATTDQVFYSISHL